MKRKNTNTIMYKKWLTILEKILPGIGMRDCDILRIKMKIQNWIFRNQNLRKSKCYKDWKRRKWS